MQRFYDDITVHGTVLADKLSGELSESTRKPIDDQIASVRDELLETTQKALTAAQETIDILVAKNETADEDITNLSERVDVLESNDGLAPLQETIRGLVAKYNTAIEVINNLSERVTALESNYDPTVIGEPPAIKKQGE